MAAPGDLLESSDEEDGVLVEEDIVHFEDKFAVDYSKVPIHLRPILYAAESGDINDLRVALDNFNGSLDEPVGDGDTILHLTCLNGHLACVQLLLERGANLEAKDAKGGIPLHDACAAGYKDIVKELMNHANDLEHWKRLLDTVNEDGETPLHHAARAGYEDVVALMLDLGASPTMKNVDGKTPAKLAGLGTNSRRILEEAFRSFICTLTQLLK